MSQSKSNRRFYRVDSGHDFTQFMDRGQLAACQNRWTFEIAWEVANKGSLQLITFHLSYSGSLTLLSLWRHLCLQKTWKSNTLLNRLTTQVGQRGNYRNVLFPGGL